MFFVDTNVVVYATTRSRYQGGCDLVLEAVMRGQADGRTSVAVLEEIWHLELRGVLGNLTGLTAETRTLFAPILAVTDEIFGRALELTAPGNLGANDRVHAATCLMMDIPVIVSADAGFDDVGGIRRVDPLDEKSLHSLLDG